MHTPRAKFSFKCMDTKRLSLDNDNYTVGVKSGEPVAALARAHCKLDGLPHE